MHAGFTYPILHLTIILKNYFIKYFILNIFCFFFILSPVCSNICTFYSIFWKNLLFIYLFESVKRIKTLYSYRFCSKEFTY